MIKIKLIRKGKKKSPFYRLEAVEEGIKMGGKSHANLGFWFPQRKEQKFDKKLINEWITKGAILTPSVKKLIQK